MPEENTPAPAIRGLRACALRHLRFGWWGLLCFLTLGLVLEALHGFKIGWYLNVDNEVRRLMLTLAHTHGTLLAVVNIAFGLTLQVSGERLEPATRLASPCLMSAGFLLPGGFLLGGIIIHQGDPGLGILLVPVGGLILLLGVLTIALAFRRQPLADAESPAEASGDDRPKRRRRR